MTAGQKAGWRGGEEKEATSADHDAEEEATINEDVDAEPYSEDEDVPICSSSTSTEQSFSEEVVCTRECCSMENVLEPLQVTNPIIIKSTKRVQGKKFVNSGTVITLGWFPAPPSWNPYAHIANTAITTNFVLKSVWVEAMLFIPMDLTIGRKRASAFYSA